MALRSLTCPTRSRESYWDASFTTKLLRAGDGDERSVFFVDSTGGQPAPLESAPLGDREPSSDVIALPGESDASEPRKARVSQVLD
jgi:hypothetical protein